MYTDKILFMLHRYLSTNENNLDKAVIYSSGCLSQTTTTGLLQNNIRNLNEFRTNITMIELLNCERGSGRFKFALQLSNLPLNRHLQNSCGDLT